MTETVSVTEKFLINELRLEVAEPKNNQRIVAQRYDIHPTILCDVLAGRRPIPEALAKKMGFTKVIRFEKKVRK